MAQPPAYTRQTSFTGHSSFRPDEPHSGEDLDAEFNAIKDTLDGTRANLALIQRDDGGLKNGVVGADALSDEVMGLITGADAGELVTPEQLTSALTGYSLTGHAHVIADVTGLQAALNAKQPAGDYAASIHDHDTRYYTRTQTDLLLAAVDGGSGGPIAIGDVTGLTAALAGKQAAGSYAASVHAHVIGDVTGLQAALDGKQAAGSYAASAHTHTIANVTGLQAALDGKQASGSYVTTANFTWDNLSGIPATFAPSTHDHDSRYYTESEVDGFLSALSPGGSVAVSALLQVQHTTAQGVTAGALTSGSDQTRTLNTTTLNQIAGASLASNQITLPAGTYTVDARVPFFKTNRARSWLYNVTDGAIQLLGTTTYALGNTSGDTVLSIIRGRFTITAPKTFEVRSRVELTNATNGGGVESNFGGAEIYTDVLISKAVGGGEKGLTCGVTGNPDAGEKVQLGKARYAFTPNSGNCSATALTAFTSAKVFTLKKTGNVTVGTFSFAASGTVATVSMTGAITAGDMLWLECPATQDATGADLAFELYE